MANDRIKVVGYAQKQFFENGIEYRPFSPDLVGLQLATAGDTPLFTMGNFAITTNMEPKSDKTFVTNKFSNFISLTDLDLTVQESQTLLNDNAVVILNLDKTNLNYYALFGSLSEFVRISLENIITNWPASLYITPISQNSVGNTITGYTFQDYTYDSLTEIASFKINTNFIDNKFQINYLQNGTIVNTFNATNDLRNITVNYSAYSILYNNIEYPVLNFTGATYTTNDYIYLNVKGNVFSGLSTASTIYYHIKPNKLKEEQFFNTLPDFEYYLLNRQVTPIYTATFKYPIKSDEGVILYITNSITWPVSDGYNIDFDTTDYINYASKLLDISTVSDLYQSNLMNRFLVTESISNFDTTPVHLDPLDEDTSGQKMNKSLQIYGRAFDEINNFISGIAFANVVSYNKQDNTPDIYLKNLARVLGWELISSVIENDLLANYVTTSPSTYSGQSVGLTAVEADTELWRRLILNTPWLWKSKGARKSIEFLLKFIGAPQGLVKFNEYVYVAEAPINIDVFQEALSLNGLNTDLSLYPIDSDGFPRPLADTNDMYFQNYGLWYRETGGSGSTIDILTGNNPHLGPYDGGYKYINQFRSLIPNFSAVTISSETTTVGSTNLFTNYTLGGVTDYSGPVYVEPTNNDGTDLSDCIVVTSTVITDPQPKLITTDCGCTCDGNDENLSICIEKNNNITTEAMNPCYEGMVSEPTEDLNTGYLMFKYEQYNPDGSVYKDGNNQPIINTSKFLKTCWWGCANFGGVNWVYSDSVDRGLVCCNTIGNCGCSIACSWSVGSYQSIYTSNDNVSYLVFDKQFPSSNSQNNLSQVMTNVDGCNCVTTLNQPILSNIKAPVTITSNGNYAIIIYELPNGGPKTIGSVSEKSDLQTTLTLLVESINTNSVTNSGVLNPNSYPVDNSFGFRAELINGIIYVYPPYGKELLYANTYFVIYGAIGNNNTSINAILNGHFSNNVSSPVTYTIPVPNITDPFTGEVGYACQLTQDGINDLNSNNSVLKNIYNKRKNGEIGCSSTS